MKLSSSTMQPSKERQIETLSMWKHILKKIISYYSPSYYCISPLPWLENLLYSVSCHLQTRMTIIYAKWELHKKLRTLYNTQLMETRMAIIYAKWDHHKNIIRRTTHVCYANTQIQHFRHNSKSHPDICRLYEANLLYAAYILVVRQSGLYSKYANNKKVEQT